MTFGNMLNAARQHFLLSIYSLQGHICVSTDLQKLHVGYTGLRKTQKKDFYEGQGK